MCLNCVVRCGVVQCGAVQCGAVWCGAVWCGVVQCCVVWCSAVWCGAVRCSAVQLIIFCLLFLSLIYAPCRSPDLSFPFLLSLPFAVPPGMGLIHVLSATESIVSTLTFVSSKLVNGFRFCSLLLFPLGCIITTIFVTERLSYSYFFLKILFMCVCLFVFVFAYVCASVCGIQRLVCGVSLRHSPSEFLSQGLWLKLEFTDSARLAAQ